MGSGEKEYSFPITVRDDDVVEHLECFSLMLMNLNGAKTSKPSVAEVLIEDNDG